MNKTLPALPGKAPALPPGAFEIGYTAHDGAQHRVPLAEAAVVRFADTQPARRIRTRKGQRHLPGLWWSATTGEHVGFESWLERDHLVALDFDARRGAAVVVPSHSSRAASRSLRLSASLWRQYSRSPGLAPCVRRVWVVATW